MIDFFRNHTKLLGLGVLLTFFSAFGQTFFISLFVPHFILAFELSNGAFGSIYGTITIASAFTLIYLGKLADSYSLKKYSLWVVMSLAVSMLITAASFHLFLFLIGLWGMRLAGQALMPHTAITAMSRYFEKDRGKALSISLLGHPIGEGILPLIVTLLISFFDWRITLITGSLMLITSMLIYIFLITDFSKYYNEKKKEHRDVKKWKQPDILKSKEFFLLAPGSFIVTFLTTGLILYQLPLAESKGWTAEWMAFCLTGFAAARILSSLASGTMVDKLGAKVLFALHLFPFIIALLILYFYSAEWIAYLYMFLTGITVGLGSIVKSALQAEIFGIKSIGAVRSLFSTLTVLSTALGPILFGFLLDKGVSFSNIIVLSAILTVAAAAWNFRIGYSPYKSQLSH